MGNITVRDDDWPIVKVRYGVFTDEEHRAHLGLFLDMFAIHDGNFGAILDVRESPPLNSVQRKRVVEFWEDNQATLGGRLDAIAYVADKTVMRGVITALNWFIDYPCPSTVQRTPAEAEAWMQGKLTREP